MQSVLRYENIYQDIKQCQDRGIGQHSALRLSSVGLDIIINIPAAGLAKFANQIGDNLSRFAEQL